MKEGWEYKKLGAVADFCRGLTYKREDEVDSSDNCVLRSNNIDLESMSLNFEELKYIRPDFVIPEDKKLKANSVFVCMSNGSKQHVGKVAYIKDNMDYAFGGFMGLIVPKRVIEGKYIYYICRSSLYRQFLTQIGNGIGITNLRFSDLNNFSLPVPPLSEQQHIVEELDLLSSIIEKKKAQLNELDNLAQSLFYEMFGDPITNEKGWKVKKLKDCCKNYDSQRKPITAKDRIKGSIPYYGASGVVDYVRDFIFDGDFLLVSEDGANLVLRSTPIAFCIKGKTWVNNHAHVLKFDTLFQQKYIEFSINLRDISMMVTGCAQPKLTQAALNNMIILYPPLSLQQQFASKIEAIEHQKELIKQSIKEVETLFNSRMDYYFN